MGISDSEPLPEEVRERLHHLTDTLAEMAAGNAPANAEDRLRAELDAAIAVVREQRQHADRADRGGRVVELDRVVAESVRTFRQIAGWTQTELADAMKRLGYPWKRITVAEVERATRRRVTMEELIGLAALFSVPAMLFYRPDPQDSVRLVGDRAIWSMDAMAMLVGPEHERCVNAQNRYWKAARRVALVGEDDAQEDWRPCASLHYEAASSDEETGDTQ